MVQPIRARANVVEDFPLYDTCQIRANASSVEGYVDFLTLGQQDEIPFFTVRNRSEVGLAYTNKESKDSMPFAYGIHSLGVQFIAPAPFVFDDGKAIALGEDDCAALWFAKTLPLHAGLILKVREDEKILTTAELSPAGSGIFGGAVVDAATSSGNLSNGWPDLGNRFRFAPAVDVPRGAVLQVVIKLSKYAKDVLTAMTAGVPGEIDPVAEKPAGMFAKANCALIRVSLLGKRAVQQRGELAV